MKLEKKRRKEKIEKKKTEKGRKRKEKREKKRKKNIKKKKKEDALSLEHTHPFSASTRFVFSGTTLISKN